MIAWMLFWCALPVYCQSNRGELRLKVTDPSGLGVKTIVLIVSEANQYRNSLTTTEQGTLPHFAGNVVDRHRADPAF